MGAAQCVRRLGVHTCPGGRCQGLNAPTRDVSFVCAVGRNDPIMNILDRNGHTLNAVLIDAPRCIRRLGVQLNAPTPANNVLVPAVTIVILAMFNDDNQTMDMIRHHHPFVQFNMRRVVGNFAPTSFRQLTQFRLIEKHLALAGTDRDEIHAWRSIIMSAQPRRSALVAVSVVGHRWLRAQASPFNPVTAVAFAIIVGAFHVTTVCSIHATTVGAFK